MLKHFSTKADVLAYVADEILATLNDDLERMEGGDAQHYTDEECETMRAKIADIESVDDLIRGAAETVYDDSSAVIRAARGVFANWNRGDLAGALRRLRVALEETASFVREAGESGAEWSAEDDHRASAEGWAIFRCVGGVDHGTYQLQKDDEVGAFDEDDEAWRHVVAQAAAGSPLHRRALRFLKRTSPVEHQRIIEASADLDLNLN